MSSPRRVLLTGGTGFIGANLTRRLLSDGHEVHLLVRPGYQSWRLEDIRADLHLHEADLADQPALTAVVAGIKPAWVFHLATYGAYSWQTDLQQIVQTNFVGTTNLVPACLQAGFEAFVHAGTSSEYGYKDHPPTECEWVEPNSHYAVTKASATLFCRYTAQKEGVRLRTLRLYSAYGPYEDPRRLIPTLIRHGLDGTLPPLVNPDIARDYVYVDDICEAFILAAECEQGEPDGVYNVGTGTQTTLREVVALAREELRISAEPQWGTMPDRQWDTTTWVADSRKIRAELGWQPTYPFPAGFRRVLAWSRTHSAGK